MERRTSGHSQKKTHSAFNRNKTIEEISNLVPQLRVFLVIHFHLPNYRIEIKAKQ